MRRHFSQILILLLLVLSPVSYSSSEIPDFCPESPITDVFELKVVVAGIDGSRHTAAAPAVPAQKAEHYAATSRSIPQTIQPDHTSFGRAPPA
jgi:hypothetical protein